MNIYVKELDTGEIFQFPMLPEAIECRAGTKFIDYDIMGKGPVKLPLGEELTSFSWSGMLPGAKRRMDSYICQVEGASSAWMDPVKIQQRFSVWRAHGKKLLLTVTDTPINHEVFLTQYQCTYSGGAGDTEYSISFVRAKDILIELEAKAAKTGGAVAAKPAVAKPAAAKQAKTYTVKYGDSLYKIAQNQLKDASRWMEIYNLNSKEIARRNKPPDTMHPDHRVNPFTIYAGMVLKLPT